MGIIAEEEIPAPSNSDVADSPAQRVNIISKHVKETIQVAISRAVTPPANAMKVLRVTSKNSLATIKADSVSENKDEAALVRFLHMDCVAGRYLSRMECERKIIRILLPDNIQISRTNAVLLMAHLVMCTRCQFHLIKTNAGYRCTTGRRTRCVSSRHHVN